MLTNFRYALRMLLKTPGFSIIAIITLALGIGANSAIFSVIDTVMLRPLPFKDPQQLVELWGEVRGRGPQVQVASYPDYKDFRDQSRTLALIGAYTYAGAILKEGNDVRELTGLAASSELITALGVPPLLGRNYTRNEDKPGAPDIVILSFGLWQRAFAGDPKIIGRQINLSGRPTTVIGVMPASWRFPVGADNAEYVTPLESLITGQLAHRGAHFLTLVGRLKSGVSLAQANAEVQTIAAHLAQQYPDTNLDRSALLRSLRDDIVGPVRPALMILLGAVALVLCIACANVANLLLARSAARSREMAIRTALGASRARIVWQLLAESFLLAAIGGSAGLFLAWWGVDALRVFGPQDLPRIDQVQINAAVCSFTFGLAILCTIGFGLVPALQLSNPQISDTLQQGTRGSTGGVHSHRVRAALIIGQVALSLLLLAGAGLLIQSFFNLRAAKTGFDPSRVLTLDLSLSKRSYPEPQKQLRTFDLLMAKFAALPGVQSVGGINPLPFSGDRSALSFTVAGDPPIAPGNHPGAGYLVVQSDYFRTMSIPLLAGRLFQSSDNSAAPKALIVNEAFARKFLANKNPIGQKVIIDRGTENPPACEVVGVVGDAKHDSLREEPQPEFFVPFAQEPQRQLNIVLRTSVADLSGMNAAVRRAIQDVDRDIYVPPLRPMDKLLAADLAQPRFNMALLGLFAGLAMILAAIGIYGVIAYNVAQRTREIGIRMALGAQRADMLRMILRQSMVLVGAGMGVGLVAALLGTRLLNSLLYGVTTNDFSIYFVVVILLSAAAFFASFIPARRAMAVDPMVALRYE